MLFDFIFPGYSDTIIICLGYRQRVQYVCVCTNVSSTGRSVDRYFSLPPPPPTALCPAKEKKTLFYLGFSRVSLLDCQSQFET